MQKTLLKAYFESNSLVKQHIDSYNDFVNFGMQRIVDRVGVIETNVEGLQFKLGEVKVLPPTHYETRGGKRHVLPMEARIRNLTYHAPVFLYIIPVFNGIEKPVYDPVFIGEIPVLVKSCLCPLSRMTREELIKAGEDPEDPGGYFIINGSERVLVSVEDLAPNRIMASKEKTHIIAKIFSTLHGFRARCAVTRNSDGIFHVEFPSSPNNIRLIEMLRVLGIVSDEEILSLFSDSKEVRNDILLNLELEKAKTQEEAIESVSKKLSPGQPPEYRISRMDNLIDVYLLPHISTSKEDRRMKAEFLAKMAERTVKLAYKKRAPDDKDHYSNKIVKLTGHLMEDLFRYAFQFLVKDLVYQTSRADERGRRLQVRTLVRPDALIDRIKYAMATGNWIGGHTGVSQLLDRVSFASTISHLRRVISPLSKQHPHFKARDLHGTHWGKLCPSETPEGPSCSLVKNMSICANVSQEVNEDELANVVKSLGVE